MKRWVALLAVGALGTLAWPGPAIGKAPLGVASSVSDRGRMINASASSAGRK